MYPIGIHHYWAFVISGIILNLIPGNDTVYIVSRSIAHGRRAGIISALGIGTGCLVHITLTAFGLAAILVASTMTFRIIQYSGAAYIAFLGVTMLLSKPSNLSFESSTQLIVSNRKIYLQGMLTNVLNPKVILFFLSFLPQFVDRSQAHGALPFIILGLTFLTTGTIYCLLLGIFAASLAEPLRKNERWNRALNIVCGLIFLLLAVNLLR